MAGGSRNKSQSSSVPVNLTPAPFEALQSPFADVLRSMFTSGFDLPEGPYSAAIPKGEATVLGQVAKAPAASATSRNFLDTLLQQGGGENPMGPNPFTGNFNPLAQNPSQFGTAENPFLTSMIQEAQRTTRQGLEETLSRTLPGRFTQAGQFTQPQGSSAFDRAAAIATRGVADAISGIATNLTGSAYESERDRGLQRELTGANLSNEERNRRLQYDVAAGQLGSAGTEQGLRAAELQQGITNAEVSNLTQKLQAAALPRLVEQYGIDKGLELFQSQMDSMLAALGIAGGVTRPVIANRGEEKSSGSSLQVKW